MTRIALIGPGAVGGTVAAWLAQNPALSVIVCARTTFSGLEIEAPGGPIQADPTILTDPAQATPVDWVLIATKTYDTASAEAWLDGLIGPETRLAVLRNGVEHLEPFLDRLPADRIVPAVVDIPAERRAPGRILQRRDGSIRVPDSAAGRDFVALFAHTPIAVSTTSDFKTEAWKKLALNCAGAVNALILKPSGVAHDAGVAEVMRTLVREGVAVGRAEGADLSDDLADAVIDGYRAAAPDGINSLHADRLAGRPMELDARNGVIVRLGARHGIAAPANAMIVALINGAVG